MDDLHTAELEAKVQTYEHIDKIREMLRLFATELVTRGETHNRSKLKPAESKVFAEFTPKLKTSTYGSDEYKGFLRDMKPALDHHYANNRHHPEHHEGGIDGMNLLDVLEMWVQLVLLLDAARGRQRGEEHRHQREALRHEPPARDHLPEHAAGLQGRRAVGAQATTHCVM